MNEGLEQTWRRDPLLFGGSGFDYFDVHCSLIEQHEPLKDVLPRYLKPGDLVLEAGCGAGRWMAHLLRSGYRCVGVDYSGEILLNIHRRYRYLVVAAGDVQQLPLQEGSFDAVLSSYVFEHFVYGPGAPLRESYRILKPGGILLFIVPFNNLVRRLAFNRFQDLAVLFRRRGREMAFHEYRFSRAECRRHLEAAGFEILELGPDDFVNGWNKGLAVDYSALHSYFPELPPLPADFVLPPWAERCVQALSRWFPWSCAAGITCVARKPLRATAPAPAAARPRLR
jgi:ubiquinone/menaquinone biosynthesis C-methylase UbiE